METNATDLKLPPPPTFSRIHRLVEVAYHSNGTSGQPFYVVKFEIEDEGEDGAAVVRNMIAVVGGALADGEGPDGLMAHVHGNDRLVSVLDVDLAARGLIGAKLADDNRWRGDRYQRDLEEAIRWHQTVDAARFHAENAAARERAEKAAAPVGAKARKGVKAKRA